MKARPARLLFPAVRWDSAKGFDAAQPLVEIALKRGAGGFIIFGGEADAARQLIERTQSRCDYALLFGSDLERGAGQQFIGATQLPPQAALGFVDDVNVTARAGGLTAREARAVGINWVFAPDSDLDNEERNPIVGTRSFGARPHDTARHVAAWIEGCRSEGVLSCAKHFPGHGRTTEDSHAGLPHVKATRAQLDDDLEPFRSAVRAGVDAVMTAHVVYDAIDPATAATLSQPVIMKLLRDEMRFDGLVVTDGMGMQGLLDAAGGSAPRAGIAAVNAGCDVLLYPENFVEVADALDAEMRRTLVEKRVDEALDRIRAAAERAVHEPIGVCGIAEDVAWAQDTAGRTIQSLRDQVNVPRSFDLITVDDDLGGPHPAPSRAAFVDALRDHGFDPTDADSASADRAVVVAVYADIRAWKGRPGISADALAVIGRAVSVRRDAVVVLFGHPRLAERIAGRSLVAAWGGEAIMQRAAARWLAIATGRITISRAG